MIDHGTPHRQRLIRSTARERSDYQVAMDPDYWVKLSRSIAWLQDRQIWRGESNCSHQYTNSTGRVIDRQTIRIR